MESWGEWSIWKMPENNLRNLRTFKSEVQKLATDSGWTITKNEAGNTYLAPTEIDESKFQEMLVRIPAFEDNNENPFRKLVYQVRYCSPMAVEADRISYNFHATKLGINNYWASLVAYVILYDGIPIAFASAQGANNQYGCKGLLTYVHPSFRGRGLSMKCYHSLWNELATNFGVTAYPETQIGNNVKQFTKKGYKKLTNGRVRKDGRITQVIFLIGSEAKS